KRIGINTEARHPALRSARRQPPCSVKSSRRSGTSRLQGRSHQSAAGDSAPTTTRAVFPPFGGSGGISLAPHPRCGRVQFLPAALPYRGYRGHLRRVGLSDGSRRRGGPPTERPGPHYPEERSDATPSEESRRAPAERSAPNGNPRGLPPSRSS